MDLQQIEDQVPDLIDAYDTPLPDFRSADLSPEDSLCQAPSCVRRSGQEWYNMRRS